MSYEHPPHRLQFCVGEPRSFPSPRCNRTVGACTVPDSGDRAKLSAASSSLEVAASPAPGTAPTPRRPHLAELEKQQKQQPKFPRYLEDCSNPRTCLGLEMTFGTCSLNTDWTNLRLLVSDDIGLLGYFFGITGLQFLPLHALFDALSGTLNTKSWELHCCRKTSSGKNDQVPNFVFLMSWMWPSLRVHLFCFDHIAQCHIRSCKLIYLPMWPFIFIAMLMMWAWSKTFLISFYKVRGLLHQTWVVPRYGFQYFLPFAKDGINDQIEQAFLRADKMGIKVLSLAALNKNEALNGGGTLFVNKHPDLKVRVVYGNTLTTAVILNEIPANVKEVFMTGATS